MEQAIKTRIQTLLSQIKHISENILKNLFTLGNDVNTKSIISYTYSPHTDIVYIYCNDSYSANLLKRELKHFFNQNNITPKSVEIDEVNKMYIIEVEFGNKEIIELNIEVGAKMNSIDNRYL